MRDRAKPGFRETIFSIISLGWDGAYKTCNRYEMVYLLLAGLATPLVVSPVLQISSSLTHHARSVT